MSDILTKGIFGVLFLDNAQASSAGMLALYVALACVLPGVIGYLLGSVNAAVLISKVFYRDDIRRHGSGNAGMTNMMRTYGTGAAIGTLLGDMLKTILSVAIGALLAAEAGMYIAGMCSVIGHVFPVFFGFKGGKGVASTAALVLCTEPWAFAVIMLIFFCIVATTKYLSLGSVMCAMMYPLVLNRIYLLFRHTEGVPFIPTAVSFILMVLIVAKHKENIQRLMRGKESKFSFKKSVKTPDDASSGKDGATK
ncbi:MAG: glycerol-3-phosphate 1-O-acyltransferase PlsY [Clostridia bacterium]|nr:glycerol-3-phosphate 1-O-acyltransferase PlsY [Clostridia bacterium]